MTALIPRKNFMFLFRYNKYQCRFLSKGSKKKYDLVVIGGGSGGLACAKEAGSLGKKVAVLDYVEPSVRGTKWGLGGTCVNVGCIPKKLYHHASLLGEAVCYANHYGWNIQDSVTHDWHVLREAVIDHIKSLNWGHRVQLKQKLVTFENLYAADLQKNVDYFNSRGKFLDPHTIEMTDKANKKETINADKFVIAVGGRPRYPDDIPGAVEYSISSDDLFSLAKPPGKTLVIGASYIALECAGFLTGLGFETSLMVRSICLRGFDQQMAELVAGHMCSQGTRFIRRSVPLSVAKVNGTEKLKVIWKDDKNSISEDVYDTVMFAVGRQAQTKKLGLEEIGVNVDPVSHKIIAHGEQSSVPHIFAIGDVLHGKPELTPVAIKAGRLLAHRLFSSSKIEMDYESVATTVFTPLEYGCVGLSEEAAAEKYGEDALEVYHAFYQPLEYSLPHKNSEHCYIKAVCKKEEPQIVLGLHITGPHAGEIIQGFSSAMKCGLSMKVLQQTVGIHPTVAEEVVKLNITKRSGLDPTVTGC